MTRRGTLLIWFGTLCLGAALAAQDSPESKSEPAQQQSSAQQQPKRVRVSESVMQAFILKKVQPKYPQEAHDKRIQGVVLLKGVIGKEGAVAEVLLVSGHPALAQAAIDAVKQWKYKPYLLNGRPVEVETQIQVIFTLVEN